MKILLTVIVHYQDHCGGSPKIVYEEAQELARLGHEVWVLAGGEEGMPEHEEVDRIHLLRYHPGNLRGWNPNRASAHQRAARAMLARHLPEVDAIHSHIPLIGLAALDFYGDAVRSSYTIHSPASMEMAIQWRGRSLLHRLTEPIGRVLLNRIEAQCLRRSHAVTALSKYTIDCVREIHGAPIADKIQLIPGWVDTSRFVPVEDRESAKRRLNWKTDLPVLFSLRRLETRMGLDRLLDATSLLLGEGLKFQLYLGGDGSLRKQLEAQSRALGIDDSVRFLGRMKEEDLPLAYAACDAFVLPTAALECFGIIVLEALSAGRPVLATPVGAIPEIVNQFEPRWLAKSTDVADIAQLLRSFLEGQLPSHAPEELRKGVERAYSIERTLKTFLEATVLRGASSAETSELG